MLQCGREQTGITQGGVLGGQAPQPHSGIFCLFQPLRPRLGSKVLQPALGLTPMTSQGETQLRERGPHFNVIKANGIHTVWGSEERNKSW